uniref:Uncharacterized protein n=1 Tax=Arundo donax TaxID=35708 RepID=A0A0A9DY90_ARUDO
MTGLVWSMDQTRVSY